MRLCGFVFWQMHPFLFFNPPTLICVILDPLLIKNYSLSESLARSCSDSHAILHLPPFLPFTLTSFYGGNK